MNSIRRIVYPSLLCVSLIAGCATTPKINTEFKTGADFSRYRTFTLMPLPATGPASDPGMMLRLAEPARQAVTESLTAKGYQPAGSSAGDFTVNLRGQSQPKVEVTNWGYSRSVYGRYGQVYPVQYGSVDVRNYEERTLAVEIYDNRSKDMVWVGWVTRDTSGKVKVERVVDGIKRVLSEFPPGSAPQP